VAGISAILLNTLVLAAADLVPLSTAHGGLLRLLVTLTGGILRLPTGASFQTGFHVTIGLAMAQFYAFGLEPWMRGPSWRRGFSYGVAVWLVNAFVVLPIIGEGVAGSRSLTLVGIIWFAGAHMLFFVVQAILFARLRSKQVLST
jgi:hypothetical protein